MKTPGERAQDLERALLALDRAAAEQIINGAASAGGALHGLETTVMPALESIGKAWEKGTVALSQVYMSGRICEELVDLLLPIGSAGRKSQPRMAIATLEDHHALGKRMVYATLRASGYEVSDYGKGISATELAGRAIENGIEVLLVSTLLLRAALRVRDLKSLLQAEDITVIVGGAPYIFDARLYREVGADAMCSSASEAPGLITRLTGTDHD